jgi:hypothetical protein
MDYICVYEDTCAPASVPPIPKPIADFNIYPNPSHGLFTLQIINGYGQIMDLQIYNMMGEKIKNQELKQVTNMIDLKGQPNGVYFCRILDKNGIIQKTLKIMVMN